MNTNGSKTPTFRGVLRNLAIIVIFSGFACRTLSNIPSSPTPTELILPTLIPSPLPPIPVVPGEENPDEPVFIKGDIPFTSPFFVNTIFQPFVLLEDEAGFVKRDKEFVFRLEGQALGPVEVHGEDKPLTYNLALPSIPQGTQVDVDNDGEDDPGVQIFAIAYWSNIWGGPFLERRDGTGWSTAYVSTVTDPEQDDAIVGGILIVWAPNDSQSFPTGFGEDGSLFTPDDPTAPIPAGYNLVNLSEKPFRFYKEARPTITLYEGDIAVNDYSTMSYSDAFETMFSKVAREYPFTPDKNIDWAVIKEKYLPDIALVTDDKEFYKFLHDFIQEIPDAHVGMPVDGQVFFDSYGGSIGLVLAELSDKSVIVTNVIPDSPADKAGIQPGAEITSWNDVPVTAAIDSVVPYFGPYSTQHHRRLEQVVFLTRAPVGTKISLNYRNPGATQTINVRLKTEIEYQSLFASLPELSKDPVLPPVEGQILDDSGLGYIRVNTFSADYSLMASLWDHFISALISKEVPGIIIDLRVNSGGSGSLALDFAGYFFDRESILFQSLYYNENTGFFEKSGLPAHLRPGPEYYEGPIGILVSPYCISACESFAYALSLSEQATVVGHFPTAGAFGEVGRGQYQLPGDITMQFPTGRHETPDGKLVLEGVGVIPDIVVPVTAQSAMNQIDAVLDAAIEALKK